MNFKTARLAAWCAALLLSAIRSVAADAGPPDEIRQPHTPTLIFYLTGVTGQPDVDVITASVPKLKSAAIISIDTNRSYARIRFDSHVVSYHQVAQVLADAGATLGKNYQPYLVFSVAAYAQSNNAVNVDAIFAGKRLNSRVHVTMLDKARGLFAVHFLPLKVDPHLAAPQGFNGGHLHHPVSDPPPRGLGLTSDYAAGYDERVRENSTSAQKGSL